MVLVLTDHPRGFLFGSAYDECLGLFDAFGTALEPVCHDWIERIPLSIPDGGQEMIRRYSDEYRRLGIRMEFPEHLPPFQRVTTMEDGRPAYHRPVPAAGTLSDGAWSAVATEVLQLVVQGEDGQAVRLEVPTAPNLFLDGSSVLAAWDQIDGTRIAFRTLGGN